MSKTANRSFLLAISKIVVIILNTFLLMILSRYFSTYDYGIYKDIILKETMISIFGEMGLASAAIYFLSGKNKEQYLSGILNISLILVIVSIPFSFYFSPFGSYGRLFFIILVLLKLLTISSINMMIAVGRNRFLIIYSIVPPLISVALVFMMSFMGASILSILFVLVFKRIVETIISIIFWFQIGNPFRLASKETIIEILVYSLPLALSSVVGVLNMNVDKLMVKSFFSIEEFALFSNGAYELPILQIFSGSLFTVMIPRLKELKENNSISDVAKNWNRLGEITSTIIVPLTVALIFFSDSFIIFMFSEKYTASIGIFRIYQFKNLFRIYLYGSIFIAFAENRKLLINSIISLIINTVLNFLFIRLYGLNGVAYATVISLFLLVVLQCFQISRFLNIKIYQTYPILKWLGMIIITTPISFFFFKISINTPILWQVAAMIGVTVINFVIVSMIFNNTILAFLVEKIKKLVGI